MQHIVSETVDERNARPFQEEQEWRPKRSEKGAFTTWDDETSINTATQGRDCFSLEDILLRLSRSPCYEDIESTFCAYWRCRIPLTHPSLPLPIAPPATPSTDPVS